MRSCLLLLALTTGCSLLHGLTSRAHPPPPKAAVLRVQGTDLVDAQGRRVVLRGVAFGNQVWSDVRIPRQHHAEVDYQRVAEMGMNSVRFYLNYRTLEADETSGRFLADGWQWLDDNVAWARRHGIYLVLNLHVPPGGYQSNGKGKELWENPQAQARFVALWRAIAARYRGEPVIAGYDLLNEPVVTKSPEQWRGLAERAIRAVREVDPEHAIFLERYNAIAGDWREDRDRNFLRVSDPNVVYEFHFYKPFHFTHQSADWAPFAAEAQRYPDPGRVAVEWFLTDWQTATYDSPRLPAGTSDWAHYVGKPFRVSDPKLELGKPALVCDRNSGKAYFDDLVLEELGPDGKLARELWRLNLTTLRGWWYWSRDESGQAQVEPTGHGDSGSLSISGSRAEANLGADIWRFRAEIGKSYRLSGWMRGEGVPPEATCQIRLEFSSSRVPVETVGKAFLARELDAYLAWGKREQVPLYLGEFGAIRHAFESDRGGIHWVEDMLDLLRERDVGFSYHDYHEAWMGIYAGDGSLPDPGHANTALIQLFQQKLVH
jgi:endoglucanase